ncbi:zinc-dependent metalloprotease [Photobacterium sp. MCCC 1A19761]|uniref:zinc-dependent metalloprotease n=1 Tax=Photobacterium sp. MCCC 1A19761 TaxID=3115000 RepID=UPI00307DA6BE
MYKKLAIAAMVSIALYGCGAEERGYDTLPRASEQITKNSLDTESLWLYMPSTGATPRYAATQRGFFQGTPKLVKLRFDKQNGIVAEEVDRDTIKPGEESRYADVINQAPVLKIPGVFQQYRCAEDNYDECTNKEELNEDADLNWEETTHFTPDYAGIESLAVDTLNAWFTADNVEETADPRVIHWEYDAANGTINVEVERTFTASVDDFYQFGDQFEDLSFKTRFFYSLVKLDKLASKDYQTVHYPDRDSMRFGFFKDTKNERSLIGESDRQGHKFNLLNRFNPNKASIDYYLSDSYFEPKNKFYLDVTLETIAEINTTLAGTGVPPIKIVNPSDKAGVHTGDLRYNVLNLITDPVDNGLLGYGPSATNPLTGEIVHAHVNQYAGVIRSTSRRMWNELAKYYNRGEIERPDTFVPQTTPDQNTSATSSASTAGLTGMGGVENRLTTQLLAESPASTEPQVQYEPQFINGAPRWLSPDEQDPKSFSKALANHQHQLHKMAEQNMYAAEFMWVSTQSKGLIKGIDYLAGNYFDNSGLDQSAPDYADHANKTLKRWDQLNADQQQKVSDAITEHMFKSTLVHELGHNLGLRHNFMGSVDKDNFYHQDEIAKFGYDKVPAYSSIMDYGASIFDELPIYGKYDIAALTFGYSRKVEVNQPGNPGESATTKQVSLTHIDETLRQNQQAYPLGALNQVQTELAFGEKMKPYIFCTDENVKSTTTCNRFDEGTNILEVTRFRIQKYWDNYELVNRRDGRDAFYDGKLQEYTFGRWNQFNEIREVVEDLGEIDYQLAQLRGAEDSYGQNVANYYTDNCTRASTRNNLPQGAQMVCDTFDAALEAADFFVKVMSTPDHVCELEVTPSGSQPIYRFVPLSDLWSSYGPGIQHKTELPRSCFDPDLVAAMANGYDKITVLSETRDGRSHANMRANNPYQTSATAVDLLGIWPDKLLAAQMLVKRSDHQRSRDKSNMALLDVSDPRSGTQGTPQKVQSYLGYLGFDYDQYPTPIFVDRDGNRKATITPYRPDLKRAIDVPPYLSWLKYYFQMSQTTVTPMYSALIHNLVAFGYADEYGLSDSSKYLIDAITLTQPGYGVDTENGYEFSLKARNYVVTRRNRLGFNMAEKALLINGKQEELVKLENAHSTTKQNLKANGIRNLNDFTLFMLRDTEAVNLLQTTPYFESLFRGPKFTYDKANDCYSPASNSTRCHKKDDLLTAWNAIRSYKDEDPAYLEMLLASADNYAAWIAEAIEARPEEAKVYDIDPEIIWLWSTREYIQYRYALEQLPVLSTYY